MTHEIGKTQVFRNTDHEEAIQEVKGGYLKKVQFMISLAVTS